jgi:hypothetical protein
MGSEHYTGTIPPLSVLYPHFPYYAPTFRSEVEEGEVLGFKFRV